jgi:hypothetical protein
VFLEGTENFDNKLFKENWIFLIAPSGVLIGVKHIHTTGFYPITLVGEKIVLDNA